ncbi:hypothetical protein Q5752_006637 [Cryptotrichosporon argae]
MVSEGQQVMEELISTRSATVAGGPESDTHHYRWTAAVLDTSGLRGFEGQTVLLCHESVTDAWAFCVDQAVKAPGFDISTVTEVDESKLAGRALWQALRGPVQEGREWEAFRAMQEQRRTERRREPHRTDGLLTRTIVSEWKGGEEPEVYSIYFVDHLPTVANTHATLEEVTPQAGSP